MGKATVDKRHYTNETEPVGYETDEKVHPGGIQVIGRYAVIPVFYKDYEGIEIRDIENGAGATVLDTATIQICSCERNVQKDLSIGMDSIDCDLYNAG
jgi:hypothetical protein